MIDWLRKWFPMLQSVLGKSAVASPQLLGSGELQTSLGIESLANCHILIPALLNSIAITPPPLLLNVLPNVDLSVLASTPHPAFSLVLLTQEFWRDFPVSLRLTPMLQPEEVWSVIWLLYSPTTLTASMMSISPFVGQFAGSESQRAGQVPQPKGECLTSKTKRLLSPYCFFEVTRTEKRPVEASGEEVLPTEVSTRRMAEEELAYVRFKDSASSEGT